MMLPNLYSFMEKFKFFARMDFHLENKKIRHFLPRTECYIEDKISSLEDQQMTYSLLEEHLDL